MTRATRLARSLAVPLALCVLTLVVGCKDDTPAPATEAPTEATSQKGESKALKPAPAKPALVFPDELLVVSGTPSLEKLIEAVNSGANAVAPGALPPNLSSLALESMKSDLGFKDISWFKTDAPVLLAVVDPKSFDGKNQLVMLPVSDTEKALASLKEGAQRDFEGHKAFFEHRFEKVYVDTLDGYIVFTDHTAIFPKLKSFMEASLVNWKPAHALSILVDMEHIKARYGVELAQFKEMAKQTLAQGAAGAPAPEVQEWQTDMLFSLLDSMNALELHIAVEDNNLRVIFHDTAKSDTAFAKLLAASSGQKSGLLTTVPENAWLASVGMLDVRKSPEFGRLNEMSLRTYADLLELTPEDMKALNPLIRQAAELNTGDSAVSMYPQGAFPFAMHTVSRVSDMTVFRALNKQMLALLVPKIWSRVVAELKKNDVQLPPSQVGSIGEMVALAKPFATPLGVVPNLVTSDSDGVQVDALELTIDWTVVTREMGLSAQDVATVNMLKTVAGDKVAFAVATGGDRFVQAFGPDAIATAASLAKGEDPKSSAQFTALASQENWAFGLRAGALLQALAFIPDLATKKPLIEAMSKERMLVGRAKSTGPTLEASLDVPLDLLAEIIGFANAP